MTEHKKTTSGLVRARSSQMHCGLVCRNVKIITPEGRCLVRDLNMKLGAEDKVAIVGRNGVGKSTLLNVLSGQQEPHRGSVRVVASLHIVRQTLIADRTTVGIQPDWNSPACRKDMALLGISREVLCGDSPNSFGEARKTALLRAKYSNADLLLLDEPSQDLDERGIEWLIQCLRAWRGAVLIVSHDPKILAVFRHFFYMAESGARLLSGDACDVARIVAEEEKAAEKKYQRMMRNLSSDEFHSALVARRRSRKDRGGRMREIDRAPSRAQLNSKRSYAQESQGRRRKVQELRIGVARSEVKLCRESLVVKMPLSQLAPEPTADSGSSVQLIAVGASVRGRSLFAGLDITIAGDRIALTGPNGSGKTTLLDIVRGQRDPDTGIALADPKRIATIAQGASNWVVDDSLLERLERLSETKDWQTRLRGHRFPLALAMRAMSGLSPGERTRAALVALMEQPGVDLLILDEPCSGLDTSARLELASLLRTWQSGLIVASHDRQFLRGIRIEKEICLSFSHLGKLCDFSPSGP